jgi:hypothetical protein
MKMKQQNIKNRTIMVEETDWNIFKRLTKLNNTDASKELRKFIKKYINENRESLNRLF